MATPQSVASKLRALADRTSRLDGFVDDSKPPTKEECASACKNIARIYLPTPPGSEDPSLPHDYSSSWKTPFHRDFKSPGDMVDWMFGAGEYGKTHDRPSSSSLDIDLEAAGDSVHRFVASSFDRVLVNFNRIAYNTCVLGCAEPDPDAAGAGSSQVSRERSFPTAIAKCLAKADDRHKADFCFEQYERLSDFRRFATAVERLEAELDRI
ncbi:uncharacterized protein BJ171DRAFT_505859 [Polychytrium aggregatum]|uniref:uncharacterized protein n=1 Tax=Polychytrium aggregatum TaxID=110093 RepID=UPI0022FEBACC|nr:uncharacterized protein BJ171DRAFT_505859 [Polychytrium aggregatum]KAI9204451.1 hypothetical protein BJ171DRAFT_505859 [Polychytrium aggregatum]